MFDNLPTDPAQWVAAFRELDGISKVAFWVFVVAIALKIGGESLERIIRALLCKGER